MRSKTPRILRKYLMEAPSATVFMERGDAAGSFERSESGVMLEDRNEGRMERGRRGEG